MKKFGKSLLTCFALIVALTFTGCFGGTDDKKDDLKKDEPVVVLTYDEMTYTEVDADGETAFKDLLLSDGVFEDLISGSAKSAHFEMKTEYEDEYGKDIMLIIVNAKYSMTEDGVINIIITATYDLEETTFATSEEEEIVEETSIAFSVNAIVDFDMDTMTANEGTEIAISLEDLIDGENKIEIYLDATTINTIISSMMETASSVNAAAIDDVYGSSDDLFAGLDLENLDIDAMLSEFVDMLLEDSTLSLASESTVYKLEHTAKDVNDEEIIETVNVYFDLNDSKLTTLDVDVNFVDDFGNHTIEFDFTSIDAFTVEMPDTTDYITGADNILGFLGSLLG